MNTWDAANRIHRELSNTFPQKRFGVETEGNKLTVTALDEVDRQELEAITSRYVEPDAPYLVDGLPQLKEVIIATP